MKKKITLSFLALVCALLCVLSLTACGEQPGNGDIGGQDQSYQHVHEYRWIDNMDGTHAQYCQNPDCDEPCIKQGKHIWDEKGLYCKKCSAVNVEYKDPHVHVFGREVILPEYLVSEGNCTERAVYYRSCECGEKGSETFYGGYSHQYSDGQCGICGDPEPTAGLRYSEHPSYCIVSGIGTATETDIVIASTYNGKPVTGIGERAFDDCGNLTSITIPDSVTTIGHSAFSGCSGLTNISIPDSVTTIGSWAFGDCENLTSISIPDSLTSLGKYVFLFCNNLQYNEYDNALYLGNEKNECVILMEANNTDITSCNINENTKFIESYAFSGCGKLKNLTIPDSVIGINFTNLFYDCSSLTSVTIPRGVESIDSTSETFYNCGKLTSITLPDSIKEIETRMFDGCGVLTSITIPDGITSIGQAAFYDCGELTEITIPNSVTYIGGEAFRNCVSLTEIIIPDSVTRLDSYELFSSCKQLARVVLPDGISSLAMRAFYGCESLTNITIPNSVTSIESQAFFNCGKLAEITIPNGVTSIGSNAFDGCKSLTEVTVPDGVTSFGNEVFKNCSGLTSIIIGSGAENLDYGIFYGCDKLSDITVNSNNPKYSSQDGILYNKDKTQIIFVPHGITGNIIIPDGVTNIGYAAFDGCVGITGITIPNSVTSIEGDAFSGCVGITAINLPNGITSIEESTFSDCNKLTSIIIPNGVTEIGDAAFYNCSGLTSVTIPSGVLTIGQNAFAGCSELTELTLPDTVTVISHYAFSGCSGLTSVYVSDGVSTLGEQVFYGCTKLKKITILSENITSFGTNIISGNSLEEAVVSLVVLRNVDLNGIKKLTLTGSGSLDQNMLSSYGNLTELTLSPNISVKAKSLSGLGSLTHLTVSLSASSGVMLLGQAFGQTEFFGSKQVNQYLLTGSSLIEDTYYVPSSLVSVTIGGLAQCSFSGLSGIAFDFAEDFTASVIPKYAFYRNGLTAIVLPASVVEIEQGAFAECTALASVDLGQVTHIRALAFNKCTALTTITIPASVVSIQQSFGESGLTSATFAVASGWFVSADGDSGAPADVTDATNAAANLKGDWSSKLLMRPAA